MAVNKVFQPFLEMAAAAVKKNMTGHFMMTPTTARQTLAGLTAYSGVKPLIPLIKEGVFKPHSDFPLPYRIYHPAPDQALPVFIFLHGGGHVCGSIDVYDTQMRQLANACSCIVIGLDYPLAPEYPYPVALEVLRDFIPFYKDVLGDWRYGSSLILGGDSGGGALTATLCNVFASDSNPIINGQVLIYPSLDYTFSTPSIERYGSGYLLERLSIKWYFDQYFPLGFDRRQASPLLNSQFELLPPSLVITAECDPLADEGRLYAEKIKQAGGQIHAHQMEGMIHAYLFLDQLVPRPCKNTYGLIRQFMTQMNFYTA